jgi:hypothetical protein
MRIVWACIHCGCGWYSARKVKICGHCGSAVRQRVSYLLKKKGKKKGGCGCRKARKK